MPKQKERSDNEKYCNCGDCHSHHGWKGSNAGVGHGIYGLGFIGAAIYYIQNAASFWAGVLGILKALVWPAMIVYEALKFLKM